MSERIQKILSRFGVDSRRRIDKLLQEGRITVNGRVAKPGDRASLKDKICIDKKVLRLPRQEKFKQKVFIYHKPEGEICTRHDPQKRPTVFKNLPRIQNGRWINVGRLDINTSGLLIFTNDGELAKSLMHPSYEVEREYAVRIFGVVNNDVLMRLQQGVNIDGERAAFDSIRFAGGEGMNRWYHVVLREGRNREVRRLWESQDLKVSRLIRVRYGNITLPSDLKAGSWRFLTTQEQNALVQLTIRNF